VRVSLLRGVGAATAVYGVLVAVKPALLAKPSGLVDSDGGTAYATAVSLRPLGWRDAASGLAMVTAPAGAPLATAALLRVAADFGDAVLLGATLPDRATRLKAIAVSVGWGMLSVIGLLAPGAADRNR